MHTEKQKNRWYVLGAGAIGCLWASYWRQVGFPVTLLTATPRTQATIDLLLNGESSQVDIDHLTIDQMTESDASIDYLFVSTKAQHTVEAIQKIHRHIKNDATVLFVQNGLAVRQLANLLPTQKQLIGITTDGAYRTSPLSVVHAARGETHIGCQAGFLEQLPTKALSIHSCEDIEQRQWHKFAINCAINALTAIHQCRNGELLEIPAAQKSMKSLCEEIAAVSNCLGFNYQSTKLHEEANAVLSLTANNYSSMYQDINNGKCSEINYLNGYLLTIAREHSLPTPENERIVAAIKHLETT